MLPLKNIFILKNLGEDFPEYKEWLESVSNRIKDLLVPFQAFDYHHPNQEGSASIKKVLPVITEKSYEEMNISDGEDASISFIEITYNDCPDEQKLRIREDLKQYCSLDTEGMFLILKELRKLDA